MSKYKISCDCIIDTETSEILQSDNSRYLLWLDGKCFDNIGEIIDLGTGPQEPDPEFTDEELAEKEKNDAIAEVIKTFEAVIADPVECTDLDGNVFWMDGKLESAAMMRDGIELAELTGKTTMDITDYYDLTHYGISLDNARTIMLQQAASFAAHRAKKCADREAILYPEGE